MSESRKQGTEPIHEFTPKKKKLVRLLALNIGLGAILVGMLLLFIMPSLKSGPHELPVGVVGQDAVARTEAVLNASDPEGYVVTGYDSAAALDEAIHTREVMGGFDYSRAGELRVAVASAGSTAVSGTLTQMGQEVAAQAQLEPVVDDVVALPAADKTGTGIGGLAFPLVFGGIVPVVAFRALLAGHRSWILGGIVIFSLVGGFIVSLVLQELFGSTEGVLWPVAGAMALGIAALAVPLSGLYEAFGSKGFTIAAASMMFVGNPFAGIATSSVWLPGAVAAVGQLLPPGAAGSLVRAVAYFDGNGGGQGFWTLSAWVALGIVLWGIAPLLQTRSDKRAAGKAPAAESIHA
ncbi:ABC transporter permease [Corynebacterium endometrii]|uniref:ABC-2 family transporter protein n=1 Tax=Corynebacterium endometrii TaxID=2488819 RepID=A0A4P7QFG2_9CORY|nr:ABC transporter permease [Corynebacterium endometrii]QCB27347.1 hypothetical protein CENDO_00180 [Corynebacterium endometrii]